MTNCGDDVTRLWFLGLVLSAAVSVVPFGLAPLAVALEPSYIGFFRPWLECGSLTRRPIIVGIAPLLLLAGAAVLTLTTREK